MHDSIDHFEEKLHVTSVGFAEHFLFIPARFYTSPLRVLAQKSTSFKHARSEQIPNDNVEGSKDFSSEYST